MKVAALKMIHPARIGNFGHSLDALVLLARPEDPGQIADLFDLARQRGQQMALRGAGRSYNDAALNGGGLVLDLQKMDRILSWDAETGIVRVQPGVTLRQLWQRILPDGWWPPVVSGTMATTLGGCLGMNIHGKNNYRQGTIGEHVLAFEALLPTGRRITCTPRRNSDLFHGMIGGLGMLGVFIEITLQMKRVHSGFLDVEAWRAVNLGVHLRELYEHAPGSDYLVGWLDTTAGGRMLGRGQLHAAHYLDPGADSQAPESLRVEFQTLPGKFFGVVPKSLLHYLMKPFMNNTGVKTVNTAKYLAARRKRYRQTHAAFHFLLDYVPDWELSYGKQGLVQYQSFVPLQNAPQVFQEILMLSQKRGLPSYLGVTKRHRRDPFLLSHGVDGYSLALDFKVTNHNRARLAKMLTDFDHIILEGGGRFYFAKNSETTARTAARFLGSETVRRFMDLKKRCDPDSLLESDLFRRIFLP